MDLVDGEPFQFVLANYVKEFDEYRDFYAKQTGFKMMDNGAWEARKPTPPGEFIELAKAVNASELVLPDYEYKRFHTLARCREFASVISKAERQQFSLQYVLQGETYDEMVETALEQIAKVEALGISIGSLGVPLYNKNWQARIGAIVRLTELGLSNFHCLGSQDPIEYAAYGPEVRSCDGRFAFKYGLAEIPWCMKNSLPIVHRFDMKCDATIKQRDVIRHNMHAWKLFANRGQQATPCKLKNGPE